MMNRLRTPEDIEKLSGYIPKVDPKTNPLNRIIAHYYIRPFEIKCGLCGKPHMEGCIVELTDQHITNIGHICGKQFGESFERERAKNYESDYKPHLLKTITQAQASLSADQLKHHETSLVASDLGRRSSDFTKMFPGLMEVLRRRAVSNIPDVSEVVERSKDEIADLMGANPHQSREALTYKDQYVGTISGFRFPTYDWSISQGLRKLFADLAKFIEVKPRSLSMAELQRWAHWAEDFDANLGKTMRAIEDGTNFFSPTNFQLFAVLTPSVPMKDRLRTLQISDICSPIAKPSRYLARPSSTTKPSARPYISLRELRRLTGNKRIR